MSNQVSLDFDKMGGLLPAIVQDAATGDVLMLAFMNREAWERTLATGEAHYYSRTRETIWHKGGTSGHVGILIRNEAGPIALRTRVE